VKFQHVKLEFFDEVARITLTRPAKLNAISRKMRSELSAGLREVEAVSSVRSLILSGAGERAFSTGEDLEEVANLTASKVKRWAREWGDFLAGFIKFPRPLITSCHGYAMGAGWQLFLIGDYRIASEEAKFSMPEVDVGLPSIMGGAILMSIMGIGHVNRFTLTAEAIDSGRALELGLVHKVVAKRELESRTLEIARKLAGKSIEAVRLQKAWSGELFLRTYRKAIANAASFYSQAFLSGDARQSIKLFLKERRD